VNRIVEKEDLSENVVRMVIEAPDIARKRRAGQFIILKMNEQGERIPLTIVDSDDRTGTITIIFQVVGKSTAALATLKAGDAISDLQGPLGNPTEIENYGHVVCIGGGVGVGVVYPLAAALKKAGNNVTSIIGARTKSLLILEGEMKKVSDRLIVATDDGSYGFHGFVSAVLQNLIDAKEKIDRAGADDARPVQCHQTARDSDGRLAQLDHGRRDRDVRRLPRFGGRQDQVHLRGRAGIRRPSGRFRSTGQPAADVSAPGKTGHGSP
jgi:ferredoxin--NADP+ reductase